MEEHKSVESRRELSAEWIKNNVYEALEKIEHYERLMRTGCKDIEEFVQQQGLGETEIVEVQLKNMELMIVESDILIENIKSILDKDEYKKAREKVDSLLGLFYKGHKIKGKTIMPFKINVDQRHHTRQKVLTVLFGHINKNLIALRSKLVQDMSDILFLKDKEESDLK